MKSRLALSLMAICMPVFAQGNFEVQGFVGNMYGGTVNVNSDSPQTGQTINKIKLNSSISYGLTAGMNLGDIFGIEFLWNQQKTQAVAKLQGGGELTERFDISSNQYHGNFLFHFKPLDSKFRPYALIGLGATNLSGSSTVSGNSDSITKFSYGLGGGIKYYFNDHIGIRAQARYAPTYLYTSNGGLWCNWWGYCWVVGDDHYLNQGDVTVGVTFRF